MNMYVFIGALLVYGITECQNNERRMGGNVETQITIHEMKFTDTLVAYYEGGKIPKYRLMVGDSGRIARALFYHRSGVLACEGLYINRKREGKWKYWTASGDLIMEEEYRDGKLWGAQKIYYPGEKVLARYKEFKDGVPDGKWVEYFPSGKVKFEGFCKDGKLQGEVVYYYPDGKVLRKGKYKDNARDGEWYDYDAKGELVAIRIYQKGREISTKILKKDLAKVKEDTSEVIRDTVRVLVPASQIEEYLKSRGYSIGTGE